MKIAYSIIAFLLLLTACQDNGDRADAYGNFEAREVMVSAESQGQISFLDITEGQEVQAGQLVGLIDTTALHLQRLQLKARIRALGSKTQSAKPQVEVLQKQKRNLQRELHRVEALLRDSAATPQQLDELQGKIEVVDQQIAAARAQTATLNQGVMAEVAPLQAQIAIIEEKIRQCSIVNPVRGTVLLKLAEPQEITAAGKPLYTVAPLHKLELRAYVGGTQLPHIKLGQEVEVLIDQDETSNRTLMGTISWISSEAEFTPKTIQTKEERVNLVYAIKVTVPNDGSLKIGMPGEVNFTSASHTENQSDTQ